MSKVLEKNGMNLNGKLKESDKEAADLKESKYTFEEEIVGIRSEDWEWDGKILNGKWGLEIGNEWKWESERE